MVDVGLVLWTAAWIALALAVAAEVRGLRQLSVTVVAAGTAAEEAGEAVAALEDLPFVGEDVGRVGERARQAGDSARQSGAASRESIENLSILLGLTIALVPTVPLLAVWVPFRVRRRRDVRALRRALAGHRDDAETRAFLARQAIARLPYARLLEVSGAPWGRLSEREEDELAREELERAGLDRVRR